MKSYSKYFLPLSRINLSLIFLICALPALGQTTPDDAEKLSTSARNQQAVEEAIDGWWTHSMKNHESRIQWWRNAQFGMFIHWGISSLPGGQWKGKKISGYAEHLMRKEKIPEKEYLDLAHRFNPLEFNAEEWVLAAKNTGMRYFIVTAKHHDGFAMYDSEVSDFDIIDQTPFKRDPMAELAAACRKYGMKFGFYYSHAFDWEHPDAPGNDWEYNNPGGDLHLFGGRNWYEEHPELVPKAVKYLNEKSIPQIKELIRKYDPDILWFDTPHKIPLYENLRVLKEIRKIDPDVVVNGRLARSSSISFGDYKNTSDRPAEFYPVEGDWEAIPTTNESYGYNRHDNSHKPPGFFIQLLAKSASRDGNLLMNIGPMGNGAFDPTDLKILKGIEEWMDKNSESIYQTHKTSLPLQNWGVTTQKKNKLYLHVFQWPTNGELVLGGLESNISKAYLLTDLSQQNLTIERINPTDLRLQLPIQAPDINNSVIVLEFNEELATDPVRVLAGSTANRLLAFDAELVGGGFKFGDGKQDRYYIHGWRSKDQSVKWDLRLNDSATYNIVLKYAGSSESEGTFQIQLGDYKQQITTEAGQRDGEIYTIDIGAVTLKPDTYELVITPVEIKGSELMRLLQVELIPEI